MNYILTEKANEISKELFRLGVPNDTDSSLLGTVMHPTTNETALAFNLDENVLIHPSFDVTSLIELTNYTPEQQINLKAYFDSIKIDEVGEAPESGFYLGRFPFKNIVVGYADIKNQEYMESNGWFPDMDIN